MNVNGVGCGVVDVGSWGKVAIHPHAAHTAKWPEADREMALSCTSPHFPTYYYYY